MPADAWIKERPAEAAAVDMLNELVLWQSGNSIRIALGVKPGRSIIFEEVAVEIVRPRTRDQRHLRAAAPAQFGREVARHDLEFLNRIRVRAQRREVRAA